MKKSIDLNKAKVPTHLGLILDGNRRWAKEHGLTPLKGHREGYNNLKKIVVEAFDLGVSFVSAYVFSTENWDRSKEEVDYLMKLLLWIAKNEIKNYHKQNIKILFIGEEDRLSKEILIEMRKAEELTKNNTGGTLAICLNYGGTYEIVGAINKILSANIPKKISIKMIEDNLYQPQIPPIDLIIRTSGEQRISNFMLWRSAYSELYFTDVYWPAFSIEDLHFALNNYANRQRRFGKD